MKSEIHRHKRLISRSEGLNETEYTTHVTRGDREHLRAEVRIINTGPLILSCDIHVEDQKQEE
jgi:hypothetical protein